MTLIETYCATTAGVGADPAGPATEAVFFGVFLTGAFAGADFLGAAWTATLAATFFAAIAGAVFTAAFLTAAFLATTGSGFAAAAVFDAHRCFVAAMKRAAEGRANY